MVRGLVLTAMAEACGSSAKRKAPPRLGPCQSPSSLWIDWNRSITPINRRLLALHLINPGTFSFFVQDQASPGTSSNSIIKG
jgi:hypothetical protein